MVEAHAAVGFVPTRRRLADVVQQRRPPQHQVGRLARILEVDGLAQHGQRMLIDVLVLMVLVDRHPHVADLRQHHRAQPRLHHQVDARDRVRTGQQLVEFGSHPLGGDPPEFGGHALHRLADPGRHLELQLRHEARGPQHPQRIVAERHLRRRRGVEPTGRGVDQAVLRIVELADTLGRHPHRHRVDLEVAADQVVFEAVAELDGRVARHLVVAVGPERRDLQPVVALGDADGAERDAGIPHPVAPPPHDPLDRVGAGVGGEVQIGDVALQHGVAHAAPDQVQLVARVGEQRAQLGEDGDVP